MDKPDTKLIGELIRRSRLECGMTLEELAGKARISLSTLKNAEKGRRTVTDKTIASLQKILGNFLPSYSDLGDSAHALIYAVSAYNVAQMQRELSVECNKEGGIISFEHLCFSEKTAQLYCSIHEGDYFNYSLSWQMRSMEKVAKRIYQYCAYEQVDIFAFTCAHGWLDLELAYHITNYSQNYVNLYLVHPSLNLLGRMINDGIKKRRYNTINMYPIVLKHTDFSPLSSAKTRKSRRLYCVFGLLYNYEDIPKAFSHYTSIAEPGDILAFDFSDFQRTLAGRPPEKYDLRLNGELPLERNMEALCQQIFSENIPKPHEISLGAVLGNPACSVSSYTVDIEADIESDGGHRKVSVIRIHRLTAARIISHLESIGWSLLWQAQSDESPYQNNPTSMLIFVKR